ncbi:hypothetical protein MLD38_000717 [Melastoma candidum]|uniref:Uncharacterized protein n=1 Tax=Melastoma candidum TaxID=119954 RepID=A0ACB9SEX4_9MYRT|nr:hypothetical protein MLD38_000717 [Melastoma candidum]
MPGTTGKCFVRFFPIVVLVLASTQFHTAEGGAISVLVSEKGLHFTKDVLIHEALRSILPLRLPQIEKDVKVPVVGMAQIILSDISVDEVKVGSSCVRTGDRGAMIVLMASGATANLTMSWRYSYHSWLVPLPISDSGEAAIQVKGMEVGLNLTLKGQGGSLKLSPVECGCYIKSISVKISGGSSWLYQGIVSAFQGKIKSAVEEAIPMKIEEGILRLNSALQELPKEIPVGDAAEMNVTFIDDPVLNNSSVYFELDGLFLPENHLPSVISYRSSHSRVVDSCGDAYKMIEMSLHEDVLNSASEVYFREDYLQWIVDKLPDQAMLNTSRWKYIVPQLYLQYPDDNMYLNISCSSRPLVKVRKEGITATVDLAVVINVLDANRSISVACISLVMDVSGSAHILLNNLAGTIKLRSLTASLKWSEIGNLHMSFVQTMMSMVIRTIIIPYVNLRIMKGLPLPLVHGVTLRNARISYDDLRIVICSDIAYGNQMTRYLPS